MVLAISPVPDSDERAVGGSKDHYSRSNKTVYSCKKKKNIMKRKARPFLEQVRGKKKIATEELVLSIRGLSLEERSNDRALW